MVTFMVNSSAHKSRIYAVLIYDISNRYFYLVLACISLQKELSIGFQALKMYQIFTWQFYL